MLAIFVRNLGDQSQFYTEHGQWFHKRIRAVSIVAASFIEPSKLGPVLPHLPATEIETEMLGLLHPTETYVPREAGAVLISKMLSFRNLSDGLYRKHAERLDNAHSAVALENNIREATLEQIAEEVLQIPNRSSISKSILWTTQRALYNDDIGFKLIRGQHLNSQWQIVPRGEAETVQQARQWLRDYQEDQAVSVQGVKVEQIGKGFEDIEKPVSSFVKKARRLISQSRKHRDATHSGALSPSNTRIPLRPPGNSIIRVKFREQFSAEDQVLIRFVEFWAGRRSYNNSSTLSSLGPSLLRAIGKYDSHELDKRTGWLFLQELGVIPPWDSRSVYDTRLSLPGNDLVVGRDARVVAAERSSHVFKPADTMAQFRKDFKDLEVFCIDDASAMEIDDGFSLETIDGESSTYWLHIHVANPTSGIDPNHPISQSAADMFESVYCPDMVYHLLPRLVTQQFFSLAPDRPALTFSVKIDVDGNIHDTKITPSILRKVKYLTPHMIKKFLDPDHPSKLLQSGALQVGGEFPVIDRTRQRNMETAISPSQLAILRTVQSLGAARRRQRLQRGGYDLSAKSSLEAKDIAVHMNDNLHLHAMVPKRHRARLYLGDPVIRWQPGTFTDGPVSRISEVGQLVPDVMILAGEIAALWCKSRHMPMIYKGTQSIPGLEDPLEYRKRVLDPETAKLGYTPYLVSRRYSQLLGGGFTSSRPVEHAILGVEAYLKVTSPLRRYGDMVNHWQIEAVIRHEAVSGKCTTDNAGERYLRFPRSHVEGMIPRACAREYVIVNNKRSVTMYWIIHLLFRAHHFGEAELPKTYTVFVREREMQERHACIIKELGIDCYMWANDPVLQAQQGASVGDWWEAKIQHIDVYGRTLDLKPVRLVQRSTAIY